MQNTKIRHDWQFKEVADLYKIPFNDLLFQSQVIHRQNFNPNEIQVSSLLSIKTGGCAEDCKYCPQSANNNTGVKAEKIIKIQEVIASAKKAKDAGAGRFCMGAAWTSPKDKDMDVIVDMVIAVKDLGLETCLTLGMLTPEQTKKLKDAGLDYYNHNIDTSEEYYKEIITTRTFQDRLDTLDNIQKAGLKTCSGGIIGMGETQDDRIKMLLTLANLPQHPQSVPINMLVKVAGTGLENVEKLDDFDFIRTIAVARIIMPKSYVRLSAGREEMSDQTQSLCFLAGANSIFYGEKLLTTPNPSENEDLDLLARLGISIESTNANNDDYDGDGDEDCTTPHAGGCSCCSR